jgi:hypothetical protein
MLAQMATRKGIDLWKQEPNLIALFHSPLGVVLPDGKLPAFNDSGSPDLYEQAYLYEIAYAATHDPALLGIIEHDPRADREAFLFGVERLPKTAPPKLVSTVFPEAGFATLRSATNDQTVVMKFGPHGGAHGHYDKLNFVLYSHGQTLAIDPGTHPYGIPIHHEWDSMTIAHNTISVDQLRQSATTGKLLNWQVGEGWTAVRAGAGAAYKTASLRRTILLTPRYVLILDHCESVDAQPHRYDWAYHNVGTESLIDAFNMEPYIPAAANGYQHLSNSLHGTTSGNISVRFVSANEKSTPEEHESNSTPATYKSSAAPSREPATEKEVELDLQMLPAPATEVVIGNAPSRNYPSPVPFVIARRSGTTATFATLLTMPDKRNADLRAHITLTQTAPDRYRIEGPSFSDSFADEDRFDLQQHSK